MSATIWSMCSVARGRTSGVGHPERGGVGQEPLELAFGQLVDPDRRRLRRRG